MRFASSVLLASCTAAFVAAGPYHYEYDDRRFCSYAAPAPTLRFEDYPSIWAAVCALSLWPAWAAPPLEPRSRRPTSSSCRVVHGGKMDYG